MANKDPSKTEQPTSKKIEDARAQGQVLVSQEITSVAVVFGGTLLLIMTATRLVDGFGDILRMILVDVDYSATWTIESVINGFRAFMGVLGHILLWPLVGIMLCAIIATRSQVGAYFSLKPLTWRIDQMNPITGSKQVLPTVDNTVKLLLVLGKVAIISLFVGLTVSHDLAAIVMLPLMDVAQGIEWVMSRSTQLVLVILTFFIIVAALDFLHRRKQYTDNLMMTKQEVKDEAKNAEGDPKLKGRIRQKMREMTMMRMIVDVPNADVVITNPVHVAIALRYEPGSPAPVVIAKGLRKRALRIREIAASTNVPIVEMPPLARALYRETPIGGFVPPHLYGAVATVLAQLHNIGRRNYLDAATQSQV